MPLQIRRGTDIERQAITPAAGELIFVTNTNQLYVGNGSTPGGILATGYTNNDAQDAAAAIFTANNPAHSNVNFSYNTSTNLITAAVDLSDYQGVIKANAFKGSVFADDGSTVGGTELINAVDGSINLDGTVKGHIVPDVNVAYDLGSASLRFRDLYLSGSSIELGAATITAIGSAVNLPAGSTINGEPLGAATFAGTDLNVNIIGDDSSVIVDSSTGNINASTVTGTFVGDINGSVFADDSSIIVDSIDRRIFSTRINSAFITISNSVTRDAVKLSFSTNTTGVNGAGLIVLDRSRGSAVAKVAIQNDDRIYGISWDGYDGTNNVAAAQIIARASGVVSSGIVPGRLDFAVASNTGTLERALSLLPGPVILLDGEVFTRGTQFNFDSYGNTVGGGYTLALRRSRGAPDTETTLQNNDQIFDLEFYGHDGSNFVNTANIKTVVDGTVSTGVVPSKFEIQVTNSGGTLETALSIANDKIVTANLAYTPTTSGDWNGTAPTTVGAALDRLATLVKTLNGGTGA